MKKYDTYLAVNSLKRFEVSTALDTTERVNA